MKRQFVFILIAVSILTSVGLLYALNGKPQIPRERLSSGAIQGRVLNEDGQAVAGATVYAESLNFESGRMPAALTDTQGRFTIRNLRNDTYRVYAEKKEEGYAHPLSAFHFGDSVNIPLINVSDQKGISEITIFIGPKAAKITGQLLDSSDNKPVKDAQITLRRVDNPDYSYSSAPDANGRFKILVPSEPFTIEVSADGYEKWSYKSADSTHPTNALKLLPGSTKNLTIPIRPAHK